MLKRVGGYAKLAAILAVGAVGAVPTSAGAVATPPPVQQFNKTAIAVIAGTRVAVHWRTAAKESFLLTSPPPTSLPHFGTKTGTTWPTGSNAAYSAKYQWWATTSGAATFAIPATARPGTTYAFQLITCDSSTHLCSNSSGGDGHASITMVVAAGWRTTPFTTAFPKVQVATQTGGAPLDVTFTSDGTIWNSSEFSSSLGETPASESRQTLFPDPTDLSSKPFAKCSATLSPRCQASATSALGERAISVSGRIWFTQGGWQFYTCTVGHSQPTCPANHSEVVSFDPTTKKFCTYAVPGNDNEVVGLASTRTASATTIWYVETNVESGQPYLDSFNPALVGDGCPGTSTESYALAGEITQIKWPGNVEPAQIAVDPDGQYLWITNFWGLSISRVDISTGAITRYRLAADGSRANSLFGPEPWQVTSDAGYVYAIDYGDSNLVRINEETGQIDQVKIPLTSDAESGYGVALSGGRLYFSLADDGQPKYGAASAIGYVNIAAWESASAKCAPGVDCVPAPTAAVLYSGLSAKTDPTTDADFRGIAAGPGGVVAVADLHKVVRLTP
jgi:streptogramin lyase